jgi:replicative DNA helicase
VEFDDASTQSIAQTVALHLEQIERRRNGTFKCTPTGFAELDEVLGGGLQNGGLYLIAGRPAVGKSALAFGIALHILDKQRPVIMFTPQIEHLEVARRLTSLQGSLPLYVPGGRVPAAEHDVNLDQAQTDTFNTAAQQIATLPLITNNDARITPAKIRIIGEQLQQSHGDLDLIVVDSFEAMAATTNARGNKLEGLMGELKQIAVDLKVPVIVSSMLPRSVEARSDKRPMLTDLSAGIEIPADLVVLLYRDEIYFQDSPDRGTIELFIAKNRWGQRGVLRMNFAKKFSRISSPSS